MMVMRLLDQTSGRIMFDGDEIGAILPNAFARLPLRKSIQMVFQDPTDSLNPRFTAARAIVDPIMQLGDIKGRDALRARCEELAAQVGLPLNLLDRFPHQLSGGQKARVGIARAIALQPKLVILDEPTAALDVSVQAVVLNLLQDLKQSMGMSYLFVSHDLNVVRLLCDRVIVMRAGRIVEQGTIRAGAGRSAGRLHQGTADGDPASAVAGDVMFQCTTFPPSFRGAPLARTRNYRVSCQVTAAPFQGCPDFRTALANTTSRRSTAMSATFTGLPAAIRRS